MATTKMFKTQNDIPTANRKEMITMLNQELADSLICIAIQNRHTGT